MCFSYVQVISLQGNYSAEIKSTIYSFHYFRINTREHTHTIFSADKITTGILIFRKIIEMFYVTIQWVMLVK